MATLEEIFASMPDEAAEGTHDLLIIDPDTRQIDVPESESIFGVENDGNAEVKYFQCPRYVGNGIDLAACFLRINFQNANGDRDGYLVKDTTINGDNIYFSWELSLKVTQYKGGVQFVLCASMPGSNKTNDWHTTLAHGSVLEGLEPDAAKVEAECSDLIAQLLALVSAQSDNVEAVGAAQAAAVEAVGAEQVNAVKAAAAQAEAEAVGEIEAKKQNVLAELPADYTAMGAQVDKLTRNTAGAIICEAAGTAIQVADASDNYLQGLRIFGKTTQLTTTGKNLLDVAEILTFKTIYSKGISIPAGTYVFSYASETHEGENAPYVRFMVNDKWIPLDAVEGSTVITLDRNETHLYIYPNGSSASASEGVTATIKQLMLSVNGGEYEPYTGGMPAPNPAYPQEMQSSAPVVSVYGGNIFDISAMDTHANTLLESADSGATITATGGADKPYTSSVLQLDVDMLRGNTLIMTADSITNENPAAHGGVQLNVHRGATVEYIAISAVSLAQSLYIGDDMTELYITIYTNNTGTALGTDNTVTIKGLRLNLNQPQLWEQYKGLQTLTLANGLPGIPVSSGGNYTDADGQQWICNEVDFAKGVYIQRVATETVTGIPNFSETADSPGRFIWLYCLKNASEGRRKGLSNFALWINWGIGNETADWFCTNLVHLYYYPATTMTAEEVNALFAEMIASETPPTVLVQLTEPIETPLTEAELAAFAALHSNKPNTTILNDAGAWMAAEYVADTKLYIDQKLAALIAANNT